MRSAEPRAGPRRVANPFASLRHADFRNLWLAQLCGTHAQWMDHLTRGWLVYALTGSAAQLAFVHAARALPLLFLGLLGGVIADRVDRIRVLQLSQGFNFCLHAAVAGGLFAGTLELWHVYATALAGGAAMALQTPARQALLPATVPAERLQNAVVLNSGTLNIGQAAGPALGGLAVGLLGFAWTFVAQASLYVVAAAVTTRIRAVSTVTGRRGGRESMLASLFDGFRHIRGNQIVLTVLVLALVPMFLGNPHQSLVPVFAAEVLAVGPEETGLLLAAAGIGSLVSLAVLASLPPLRRPGRLMVLGAVVYGLAIMLFAGSGWYLLSAAALFVGGLTRGAYRTLNHTLLIKHTEPEYLGRVNSVYLLDRGLVPLGTVALGLAAELTGAPAAVFTMGLLCAVLSAGSVLISRRLWRA